MRTTPEAIDLQRPSREMLDAGDRSAAMEATSHGSALKRLLGIRFAVLVFTNLSQDHLDFHGTLEEYFDAKRRLFIEPDLDGRRPPAVVNVGDAHGRRLAEELRGLGEEPVTFELADAQDLELTARGARFIVDGIPLETKLRGRFNVENVLARSAARVLGIEPHAIATGVEHVAGVPGRFEAVDEGQPFAVLVDYAHTPEALENVLTEAREITAGRLLCVFGCGGDRDRSKRPLMGEVVARLADSAIVTSDNPRSEDPQAIIDEILAGMAGEPEVEPDREAAIACALERAGEGDVVVIAGKGHEQGQEFADRTSRSTTARSRATPYAGCGPGMIPLTLDEIGRVAPGELRPGAGDAVTGVTIDSRRVEPGDLFVAVGRGVDFADDALEAGAAAALFPRTPSPLSPASRARSARGAVRRSSPSPARPRRPRRRTSSPRSAGRTRARWPPREARTTRSAFR